MHPVMARIELEEDKLTEEDRKSDPVLAPFYDDVDRQLTREVSPAAKQPAKERYSVFSLCCQDFLQFLVDLKHVYEAYDSVIDNYEMLAPLQATGPMTRWAYLEEDIDALTELMGVSKSRSQPGEWGRQDGIVDACPLVVVVVLFVCRWTRPSPQRWAPAMVTRSSPSLHAANLVGAQCTHRPPTSSQPTEAGCLPFLCVLCVAHNVHRVRRVGSPV